MVCSATSLDQLETLNFCKIWSQQVLLPAPLLSLVGLARVKIKGKMSKFPNKESKLNFKNSRLEDILSKIILRDSSLFLEQAQEI